MKISGQIQLNIIGVLLVSLLVLVGWHLATPLTTWSLFPLCLVAYAIYRIIFELTWNRAKVPVLATSLAGRLKVAELLKQSAQNTPNYSIVDLGSGRGELTRRIARAVPTARVLGIELERVPYLQSKLVQNLLGPKNLSYKQLDFWNYECGEIDAVVFFLSMTVAQRAGTKLFKEMKPGGLVVSHSFPLLDAWHKVDELHFRSPFKEVIYVYRKP